MQKNKEEDFFMDPSYSEPRQGIYNSLQREVGEGIYYRYQDAFLNASISIAEQNPLFQVDVEYFKRRMLESEAKLNGPKLLLRKNFELNGKIYLPKKIGTLVHRSTASSISVSLSFASINEKVTGLEPIRLDLRNKDVIEELALILWRPSSYGAYVDELELDNLTLSLPISYFTSRI